MLSQRVDNVVGLIGVENSPFGYIYRRMAGREWKGPFTDLLIRNWREIAATAAPKRSRARAPRR